MKKNILKETEEKVDCEELLIKFKIPNTKIYSFGQYIKELWKDLAERSEEKSLGINKVTFSKYFQLPGIINERLFAVFDSDCNGYLSRSEFTKGMTTLFAGEYAEMIKFIFQLYDFDKDEFITKEDIRIVLSYIPLKISNNINLSTFKFEQQDYQDRIESQEELLNILNKLFQHDAKLKIESYRNYVEKVSSETFIYILIYLLEKRPFSFYSIFGYKAEKSDEKEKSDCSNSNVNSPEKKSKYLIAEPSTNSKFSPGKTLENSPLIQKKRLSMLNVTSKQNNDLLINLIGIKPSNILEVAKPNNNAHALSIGGSNTSQPQQPSINRESNKKPKTSFNLNIIDTQMNKVSLSDMYDFKPDITNQLEADLIEDEKKLNIPLFNGVLYKVTNTKSFKKMTYKIVGKDLYYYKDNQSKYHKGLHNISGVFLKENSDTMIENKLYKSFSIVYPSKVRNYFVESLEEFNKWMQILKQVTEYAELFEFYQVKDDLGSGKFGQVKLGYHKVNKRHVAIKSFKKKEMTPVDFGLVKTEIEILKICQHPNIIKLYDMFENEEDIHIVMEYCEGGDLFGYLEHRGFKLKEEQAADFIYKIASAIFYLHSYGIAHRDLKPENILMTDTSDTADLKVMDFGLGKMIGPKEKCREYFGTISYVAPEVLKGEPYDTQVDLFSIGVIAYLILTGTLPFDDENSEKEIARQTVFELTPFPESVWKSFSPEAKDCVEKLLEKNPNLRLSITDLLSHPWIKRKSAKHRKNKSSLYTSSSSTVDSRVDILKSFIGKAEPPKK